MYKSIFWKFSSFSIVLSRFIKEHLHSFFGLRRCLNYSRTKQATALQFCVRLVRVFINISKKFGVFWILCSRFIKGHIDSFFGLCRRLNNSRMKQAAALKFCLRLVRVFENISWKFGSFSIVRSRVTTGHLLASFLCCVKIILKYTFFNPIQDGLFRSCSRMGGGDAKRPPDT